MILTAAALAGISSFTTSTLSSYFAKKGLDAYFANEANFKEELRQLIEDAVLEYSEKFPQSSGRDLPFYHSEKIIDQLLKFRVMKPEEYNVQDLLDVLKVEPDVMAPTEQNLKDFFDVFMVKVNASENLKKLEIKDTFGQEIFTISKSIEGLKSHIDSLAQSYTGDLELQWKDRVDAYVKTLQQFKPATALALLENLENSFNSSTKRPGVNFMAFLEYQKGVCNGFLHQHDTAYKCYIKAHNLDKGVILYAEKAVVAYYKLKDQPRALQLCEEILHQDTYNQVAWAIILLCSPVEEFQHLLTTVPPPVVNDISFKKMLYNTSNEPGSPFIKILHELNLVPSPTEYQATPVNVDTFNTAIFWINICVDELFSYYFFDFNTINTAQNEEITILNQILNSFLQAIKDSEIYEKYKHLEFYYALTNYSLYGIKEFAIEMETLYRRTSDRSVLLTMHTANALQLSGHTERAVVLLEEEASNHPETLLLLLHCYNQINDTDNYLNTVKTFVLSIKKFHPHYVLMYINLMVELKLENQISQFTIEEFLADKAFEIKADETLVTAVANLIFNGSTDELIATLSEFANSSDNPILTDIIGSALFSVEAYQEALVFLAKNLNDQEPGRELYQYIHAKSKSEKDQKELLGLLKNWREKFGVNLGFMRLEAKMRSDLLDWEEIVIISELYLQRQPKDESIWTLYIGALHHINTTVSIEKIRHCAPQIKEVHFIVDDHIIYICNVFIIRGLVTEAFNLMYSYATDPKRVRLRSAYIGMCLKVSTNGTEETLPKEIDLADIGAFIKYEIDGRISFIELDEHARTHLLYSQFFGRSAGEVFQISRGVGNIVDTVVIRRVMNKYLSLHDEILYQAESDPYAGLSMTPVKFDTDNPKGIVELLESMFGEKHKIVTRTRETDFKAYYSGQISFSELVRMHYGCNYRIAYYNLIGFHEGIATIQRYFFRDQIKENSQFVIDNSSLLMLYQISQHHGTSFPNKFIISKYIVEALKADLRNQQFNSPDDFSIGIDDFGKAEYIPAYDFAKNHAAHLQALLDWIDENCIVELSDRTLEFIKGANLAVGENPIIDAAMSTTLLVEDVDERLLITDDTIYVKFKFLIVDYLSSTENYLKKIKDQDDPAFTEFISNRYIRYSPSAKQLNEEYLKHLSGQHSHYPLTLENISISNSGENLETAFLHIREIALSSVITLKKMKLDITAVFLNLLKTAVPEVIEVVRLKAFRDFRLLGAKHDIVMNAYYSAYDIILASQHD